MQSTAYIIYNMYSIFISNYSAPLLFIFKAYDLILVHKCCAELECVWTSKDENDIGIMKYLNIKH